MSPISVMSDLSFELSTPFPDISLVVLPAAPRQGPNLPQLLTKAARASARMSCPSDAPRRDKAELTDRADRPRDSRTERVPLYLEHGRLFVCIRHLSQPVLSVSGQNILKTLSGTIDFHFFLFFLLGLWKRSGYTADPLRGCVTLSFCNTDQSEDEQ